MWLSGKRLINCCRNPSMCVRDTVIMGWRDGTVRKMLAMQTCGLEFRSPEHIYLWLWTACQLYFSFSIIFRFTFVILSHVCMCVYVRVSACARMCMYVAMSTLVHVPKEARDVGFPELELQATVNSPTRLLRTELLLSTRAVLALNHLAVSPERPPSTMFHLCEQNLDLNSPITFYHLITSPFSFIYLSSGLLWHQVSSFLKTVFHFKSHL